MHLQTSIKRISDLFSIFIHQVKAHTALGLTDINKLSESVLVPLFREIYNFTHLEKLEAYHDNFPAVDLGDDFSRVAIQVTATSSSEKIKKTLRGFIKHRLYEQFDRLIIYIINEKQSTYSGSGFDEIIDGKFKFNKDKDIQDFTDLLSQIKNFQLEKAKKVEYLLERNFGNSATPLFVSPKLEMGENVTLNLLEVTFGSKLYIADIDIERKDIIAESRNHKVKLRKSSSTRNIVRAAIEQLGFGTKIGFDWVCHENKIVTFHDLSDKSYVLNNVIDEGTLTEIDATEFHEIDESYERVFVRLLRHCLQEMLSKKSVLWHYKQKIFIFTPKEDEDVRTEKWKGIKTAERDVFVRKWKDEKPDEILQCKHLAFSVQFRRIGNRWYVVIKPDWYFSFDGYRKHMLHDDKTSFLKRKERNPHVLNHLRFIAYFLKHQEPSTLFEKAYRYPFLAFGDLVTLTDSPSLDDKVWLGFENKDVQSKLKAGQMLLLPENS